MTLKSHKRNETPFEIIVGGQRQISDYWTVNRLTGRKLTLLRMKERRNDEIETCRRKIDEIKSKIAPCLQLIDELESHNDSIDKEVKDLSAVLKTRMREDPEDPNNFILVKANDGYLKAKIKRAGKYRWVHIGSLVDFEGLSDAELKKEAVKRFNANLLNKKK